MTQKVDISIIFPCYNEGPTLERSVDKIVKVLSGLGKRWEIIFVEDKSHDNTDKLVEKLTQKIPQSKAIFHKKNEGRGKSVSDGIRKCRGSICGFLDVDLEVSPEYIPLFIREVETGSDVVVGRRFYEGGGVKTIMRYLASKIYTLAVKLLFKIPIDDTEAGYKFFSKKGILPILRQVKNKRWFWDTEICIRSFLAGLKVSQIPVLFRRREDKKSTVKLIPDTVDYIINLFRFKREVLKRRVS